MLEVEAADLSHLLFHIDTRINWIWLISSFLCNRLSLSWQTRVQRYGSGTTLQTRELVLEVDHLPRDTLPLLNNLSHIF